MPILLKKKSKPLVKKDKKTRLDPWIFLPALLLAGLGLLIVTSSSMVISDHQFGHPFHFFFRQLTYLSLGLILSLIVIRIPIDFWQSKGQLLLGIGLILIVTVLLPGIGKTVNGSQRWISLGIFHLQPSECMKIIMIIYLSDYLMRHQTNVREHYIGFIRPMIIISITALLLLLEPDFGATSVITGVSIMMLFLAGVRIRFFIPLFLSVIAAFSLIAISAPYRLLRLTSFMNPWKQPFESGYQLTQSLMAFGRGGVWGVGLGHSVQKLFYLPEAHTDFIFAVLAEELGMVGEFIVLSLFTVLVYRALCLGQSLQRKHYYFHAQLAYGLGLWLGLQTMINIGVNIGVLPTKGLTLPLMSYGGSSLVISCFAVALLLRLSYEEAKKL